MNYETILRDVNLKATPQRLGILALMQRCGHISIEEMYLMIKKDFKSISLATLYKNIHAMIDASIVKEVKVAHQKSKFEITKESHSHLVCSECGEVRDIYLNTEDILKQAKSISDYNLKDVEITLTGKCDHCS